MRIVDDLRGDTCFFHHFGKAAQTKLVRQAVGAVAQIDNVTVAELQQMLCCQTAACQIINADRVDLIAAESAGVPSRTVGSRGAKFWIMVPASC